LHHGDCVFCGQSVIDKRCDRGLPEVLLTAAVEYLLGFRWANPWNASVVVYAVTRQGLLVDQPVSHPTVCPKWSGHAVGVVELCRQGHHVFVD
jgi:hypothetical protein